MNSIARWESEIDAYRQTARRRRRDAELSVDLIAVEEAPESLRKRIETEGTPL